MHPSRLPVTVEAYSKDWRDRFQRERRALSATLADATQELEHIGSTSVPGLAAKPTIDMMLGTFEWPWPEANDATLAGLGYTHYKTPVAGGRWRVYLKAFRGYQRGYHLHVVEHGSEHWRIHLLFRDFLREHPSQAQRYQELKLDLAQRFATDRGGYQRGKSQLIDEITRLAQRWADGSADRVVR